MRVAACISGHMRTFLSCAESQFLNIFDPNNTDIFLSTWDVYGHGKHNRHDTEPYQMPLDIDAVYQTYAKRLVDFEVHRFNEVQPSFGKDFYPGLYSMFWKIQRADLMRRAYEEKHQIQYDIVIRMRPDMRFHTGVRIATPEPFDNVIAVRFFTDLVIDDLFGISSGRVMQIYSSVYNMLPVYATVKDKFPPAPNLGGGVCWPEQILLDHLRTNGIGVMSVQMQADVERGGYDYS